MLNRRMRTFDPSVLNRIANHPMVKPYFGHAEGLIFFDELAALPDDYALLDNGEDCGAVFEWTGPRIWQVHFLALPSVRGRKVVHEFKRMRDWMMDNLADTIWGQTPVDNKAARWLGRQLGAKSFGVRTHHISGPCELFRLDR